MKVLGLVFGLVFMTMVIGCSDDATPEALNTAVTSAASYVSTAYPTLTTSARQTHGTNDESIRATNFITPAKWESTTNGDLIDPPGGVVNDASSEPNYDGAELPSLVNYRDYMKMALDDDYRRSSGDDGGTNRPTVFGRFDSVAQILGYLTSAGIAMDASGPAVGTYNSSLTVDGNDIRVIVDVTNTAVTTYYSRRVAVTGFVDTNNNTVFDTGENQVVDVLMWVRGSATELNFMQVEQRDDGDDDSIDNRVVTILKWNRSTGSLQFEYVSDTDDSVNAGNLEIFRLLIESTGGKAWVYQFTGKADATAGLPDFVQWALYTPSNTATEGTYSIRQLRTNSDVWLGNLCATFATGVGAAGEAIPDDTEPAGGGTCAGQVSDSINTKVGIMGFASSIRAHTTSAETMEDKGFPANTSPDFSVAAARSLWLAAGDSVSVSFDNRTEFIAQWDGTP